MKEDLVIVDHSALAILNFLFDPAEMRSHSRINSGLIEIGASCPSAHHANDEGSFIFLNFMFVLIPAIQRSSAVT